MNPEETPADGGDAHLTSPHKTKLQIPKNRHHTDIDNVNLIQCITTPDRGEQSINKQAATAAPASSSRRRAAKIHLNVLREETYDFCSACCVHGLTSKQSKEAPLTDYNSRPH